MRNQIKVGFLAGDVTAADVSESRMAATRELKSLAAIAAQRPEIADQIQYWLDGARKSLALADIACEQGASSEEVLAIMLVEASQKHAEARRQIAVAREWTQA